jgi:hypothetical protein
VSLVVLGQAKCEAPTSSTSGKDIARTVALRDGISITQLLDRVDGGYNRRLRDRDPEQVLVVGTDSPT